MSSPKQECVRGAQRPERDEEKEEKTMKEEEEYWTAKYRKFREGNQERLSVWDMIKMVLYSVEMDVEMLEKWIEKLKSWNIFDMEDQFAVAEDVVPVKKKVDPAEAKRQKQTTLAMKDQFAVAKDVVPVEEDPSPAERQKQKTLEPEPYYLKAERKERKAEELYSKMKAYGYTPSTSSILADDSVARYLKVNQNHYKSYMNMTEKQWRAIRGMSLADFERRLAQGTSALFSKKGKDPVVPEEPKTVEKVQNSKVSSESDDATAKDPKVSQKTLLQDIDVEEVKKTSKEEQSNVKLKINDPTETPAISSSQCHMVPKWLETLKKRRTFAEFMKYKARYHALKSAEKTLERVIEVEDLKPAESQTSKSELLGDEKTRKIKSQMSDNVGAVEKETDRSEESELTLNTLVERSGVNKIKGTLGSASEELEPEELQKASAELILVEKTPKIHMEKEKMEALKSADLTDTSEAPYPKQETAKPVVEKISSQSQMSDNATAVEKEVNQNEASEATLNTLVERSGVRVSEVNKTLECAAEELEPEENQTSSAEYFVDENQNMPDKKDSESNDKTLKAQKTPLELDYVTGKDLEVSKNALQQRTEVEEVKKTSEEQSKAKLEIDDPTEPAALSSQNQMVSQSECLETPKKRRTFAEFMASKAQFHALKLAKRAAGGAVDGLKAVENQPPKPKLFEIEKTPDQKDLESIQKKLTPVEPMTTFKTPPSQNQKTVHSMLIYDYCDLVARRTIFSSLEVQVESVEDPEKWNKPVKQKIDSCDCQTFPSIETDPQTASQRNTAPVSIRGMKTPEHQVERQIASNNKDPGSDRKESDDGAAVTGQKESSESRSGVNEVKETLEGTVEDLKAEGNQNLNEELLVDEETPDKKDLESAQQVSKSMETSNTSTQNQKMLEDKSSDSMLIYDYIASAKTDFVSKLTPIQLEIAKRMTLKELKERTAKQTATQKDTASQSIGNGTQASPETLEEKAMERNEFETKILESGLQKSNERCVVDENQKTTDKKDSSSDQKTSRTLEDKSLDSMLIYDYLKSAKTDFISKLTPIQLEIAKRMTLKELRERTAKQTATREDTAPESTENGTQASQEIPEDQGLEPVAKRTRFSREPIGNGTQASPEIIEAESTQRNKIETEILESGLHQSNGQLSVDENQNRTDKKESEDKSLDSMLIYDYLKSAKTDFISKLTPEQLKITERMTLGEWKRRTDQQTDSKEDTAPELAGNGTRASQEIREDLDQPVAKRTRFSSLEKQKTNSDEVEAEAVEDGKKKKRKRKINANSGNQTSRKIRRT